MRRKIRRLPPGGATSTKPALRKVRGEPVYVYSRGPGSTAYPSSTSAPWPAAYSTAPRSSAALAPVRRNRRSTRKQTTGRQASRLSIRPRARYRSSPRRSTRGAMAHHPTGSPSASCRQSQRRGSVPDGGGGDLRARDVPAHAGAVAEPAVALREPLQKLSVLRLPWHHRQLQGPRLHHTIPPKGQAGTIAAPLTPKARLPSSTAATRSGTGAPPCRSFTPGPPCGCRPRGSRWWAGTA